MAQSVDIKFPVGRVVWGSLYEAKDKDSEGRPRLIQNGPNAGQPKISYDFGVAIPKGSEQHWAQTPWGQTIWNTGHLAFPQGQGNAPTFAWKVTDGDSRVPNKKGRTPADQTGYPGHWVLSFSSTFPPRIANAISGAGVWDDTVNLILPGYYVEVYGSVAGNSSTQSPGIYLNHSVVGLRGFGERIVTGPDLSQIGFGATPLPAGATTMPVATGGLPVPPLAGAPGAPLPSPLPPGASSVPAFHAAPPSPSAPAGVPATSLHAAPATTSPSSPPPPVPVTPYVAPLAVAAPPPVPVTPVRTMTAKAGAGRYEDFIAAGWNDQQLIEHGMMVA